MKSSQQINNYSRYQNNIPIHQQVMSDPKKGKANTMLQSRDVEFGRLMSGGGAGGTLNS